MFTAIVSACNSLHGWEWLNMYTMDQIITTDIVLDLYLLAHICVYIDMKVV